MIVSAVRLRQVRQSRPQTPRGFERSICSLDLLHGSMWVPRLRHDVTVLAAIALVRLRDVALTVLTLMVMIPLLAVGAAATGLDPRHWSGVSLSALDLPFVDLKPYHGGSRPPVMDEVTDFLSATERDSGWVMVLGDQDGRVYVVSTRLSNVLFAELGHRFGAGTVGVIYGPMDRRFQLAGVGYESSGDESVWRRMDPIGTWTTLLFGFPSALGVAAMLTTFVWTLMLRRRHRRTRAAAALVQRLSL
jgi:hypothetical protein